MGIIYVIIEVVLGTSKWWQVDTGRSLKVGNFGSGDSNLLQGAYFSTLLPAVFCLASFF